MLVWCDFYAFGFFKRRPTCVGNFNLIQNKENIKFFIIMEKGCVQTQFSSKNLNFNDCVDKHLFLSSQVVECHAINTYGPHH
jgi:hypothetical protein